MMEFVAFIFFSCVSYVCVEFLAYVQDEQATSFSDFLAARRLSVFSRVSTLWEATRRRLALFFGENPAKDTLLVDLRELANHADEPMHIHKIEACIQFLDEIVLGRGNSQPSEEELTRIQRVYSCLSQSIHSSLMRKIEGPRPSEGSNRAALSAHAAAIVDELANNEWFWSPVEDCSGQEVEVGITVDHVPPKKVSKETKKVESPVSQASVSSQTKLTCRSSPVNTETSPATEIRVSEKVKAAPAKPPRPSAVGTVPRSTRERSPTKSSSPVEEKLKTKRQSSFTKVSTARSEIRAATASSAPSLRKDPSFSKRDNATTKAVQEKQRKKPSDASKKDTPVTLEDPTTGVKATSSKSSSTVSGKATLSLTKTSYEPVLTLKQ